MPRATNAPASRKRRKRKLKLARGFMGGRSKLFRTATETVDRSMAMSFEHRRRKKSDYRSLWVVRISAACKTHGITYSRLMDGLKKADIRLNRKMLSEIAIHDPEGFESIAAAAKAKLS